MFIIFAAFTWWIALVNHFKTNKKHHLMKVAITSTGKDLSALPDKRFGRCVCFVIFDTESDSMEVVENPNRNHNEGAGPAAVQLIASTRRVPKKSLPGIWATRLPWLPSSSGWR